MWKNYNATKLNYILKNKVFYNNQNLFYNKSSILVYSLIKIK